MFEINNNSMAVAVAVPQVSNEDILLSLADENRRIMPISDNCEFFAPLDDSKTKGITMQQLHASSDLTDRDGNLANGINAYSLILQVAELAQEYHADCEITDLFVADNKTALWVTASLSISVWQRRIRRRLVRKTYPLRQRHSTECSATSP